MNEQLGIFLVLVALLTVIAGTIGRVSGMQVEQRRIEAKCLLHQADKPYQEAVEFCKEQVK